MKLVGVNHFGHSFIYLISVSLSTQEDSSQPDHGGSLGNPRPSPVCGDIDTCMSCIKMFEEYTSVCTGIHVHVSYVNQ